MESKYKVLEKAAYIVGIVAPLSFVLQAIKLFNSESLNGFSIETYLISLFFQFVLMAYVLSRKDLPLIINSFLWVGIYLVIVVGFYLKSIEAV
jgi:uncharacterized protein with PQ loop repeat